MEKQFLGNLCALLAVSMMGVRLGDVSGQTIDEIIASSTKTVASFDFMGDINGTMTRVELDMMLTLEQYNTLYNRQNAYNSRYSKRSQRLKRKAMKGSTTRWTNNEIPYSIDNSAFTAQERNKIMLAIKEWEDNTCITFRNYRRSDYGYIHFEDGSGCSSYIGMGKGKRPISLADGCREKGVIAHEIGHAVGFYHEQNRPDRDDHVIIKRENLVHPDLYSNFEKYSYSEISTYDVPYDYKSIMHYGGRAFSGNGEYTIQTINPAFQDEIGNRQGLSFLDIKLANLMYNCSLSCKSTMRCPKEGFMDKNCQCWCPGDPIKKCDATIVTTTRPLAKTTRRTIARTTSKPAACTDVSVRCSSWARSGYCQTSNYVKTYCKSSCSTCQPTTRTPLITCQDLRIHCAYWGKRGFCSGTYQPFMRSKCPVTCGFCQEKAMGNARVSNKSTVTDKSRDPNAGNRWSFSCVMMLVVVTRCLLTLQMFIFPLFILSP